MLFTLILPAVQQARSMYQEFFNLKEPPFAITPDPRFLFLGRQHQEALAHLLYSVRGSSGFILLTGEVGAGKTTISRCLIQQVASFVDVALLFNPKLSALDLIASICDDLGIPYPANPSMKVLFDALNHRLLANYTNNRTTVLIIDEAQNLSVELLEQVRMLSNLETDKRKLLQIILIGQPELTDMLARPELRQFSQRITARYHIVPLSAAETRAFVRHRLAIAGCSRPIFGVVVLWLIHRAAQGIPRLINQICDRALLGAYTLERPQVDVRIAYAAIQEVMGMTQKRRRKRRRRSGERLLLIALSLLVALWFFSPTPLQTLAQGSGLSPRWAAMDEAFQKLLEEGVQGLTALVQERRTVAASVPQQASTTTAAPLQQPVAQLATVTVERESTAMKASESPGSLPPAPAQPAPEKAGNRSPAAPERGTTMAPEQGRATPTPAPVAEATTTAKVAAPSPAPVVETAPAAPKPVEAPPLALAVEAVATPPATAPTATPVATPV
ncbi:MAG: AAA family ATPase, partial [Magnetococcales bacterium]|nr:AAA family ATPase [Magnetococcales bacterium]